MMFLTRSLAGRLLLASMVILPVFLGLTGWYLERAHRTALEAAQVERLHAHVLTLLAEAEFEETLWMPEQMLEARLNRPESGLYAVVFSPGGRLWYSPSATTLAPADLPDEPAWPAPGEPYFEARADRYLYAYHVLWETGTVGEVPLLFTVFEVAGAVAANMASYRHSLLLWLGGGALLLIACQALILAWGLRPLKQLAADLQQVGSGARDQLAGNYPREIQAVTDGLNTLLNSEKQRRERVRNTLADLAHSLKTPLAVLRSADANTAGYADLVAEQTDHMEKIISYQLQRSVGGSHKLLQTVEVAPVLERLRDTLLKVYAAKNLDIEVLAEGQSVFRGDERDLMEVVGNLMDNACKHARRKVLVSASHCGNGNRKLLLCVEDDGEGIVQSLREQILQRGIRADSQSPGHGIGLAVTADIIATYGGRLEIDDGRLGGAVVRVWLP